MWNDLVVADPTSKILTAWIAKEEFRTPAGAPGRHD
jgi:hypothetical protein